MDCNFIMQFYHEESFKIFLALDLSKLHLPSKVDQDELC